MEDRSALEPFPRAALSFLQAFRDDVRMEIELAPGYTWIVAYRFDGEEPEQMLVRAISPERALKEAHHSLESGDLDYQVFGLVREDQWSTLER